MSGADLPSSICSHAALRRATRRLGQIYDDALAPCGLRGTQVSLLFSIAAAGAPTMSELAAMLVMDLSALGHTLKPLQRDGLVRLVPDPRDRRARRVEITEAGAAKRAEAGPLWQAMHARFEAALGADEAARLRAELDRLASPAFAAALAAA